jgi:hypothetical protein
LQDDDRVASDGVANKGGRTSQYKHDYYSCEYLEEKQSCNAQSLPGTARLQILRCLLPEKRAAHYSFLPFRAHKIEQKDNWYNDPECERCW